MCSKGSGGILGVFPPRHKNRCAMKVSAHDWRFIYPVESWTHNLVDIFPECQLKGSQNELPCNLPLRGFVANSIFPMKWNAKVFCVFSTKKIPKMSFPSNRSWKVQENGHSFQSQLEVNQFIYELEIPEFVVFVNLSWKMFFEVFKSNREDRWHHSAANVSIGAE